MKYQLIIDKDKDEEIVIVAHEKNKLINEIERLIKSSNINLFGYKDDKIINLTLDEIYAFYTQDGKVYAKTKNEAYLIKERLYVVIEYAKDSFVKINQGCLVNVGKILRFESTISGAIKVVLKNDFSDYISRRELKNVKRRMGLWKNTC